MKNDDDNKDSSYTAEEAGRFEHLIARYERVAQFCRNWQGETRFDGVIFVVSFILTGISASLVHLETSAQRRDEIAALLKVNESDAQFLLDIYEREKFRRPDWFPDIQKMLSDAKALLGGDAGLSMWTASRIQRH